jgi:hypothetical protein
METRHLFELFQALLRRQSKILAQQAAIDTGLVSVDDWVGTGIRRNGIRFHISAYRIKRL